MKRFLFFSRLWSSNPVEPPHLDFNIVVLLYAYRNDRNVIEVNKYGKSCGLDKIYIKENHTGGDRHSCVGTEESLHKVSKLGVWPRDIGKKQSRSYHWKKTAKEHHQLLTSMLPSPST